MIRFETVIPETLEECIEKLASCGDDGAVIAGGTDLYLLMENGLRRPRIVLAVGGLPELGKVSDADGEITIGAAVCHAELDRCSALEGIECIRTAAASIGSPQIRNVATVGGNIANASPAGDLLPPLLVMEAAVHTSQAGGGRQLELEQVITGPGTTTLRPDELITHIGFRKPEGEFYSGFIKIGLRNALAISVASAAIFATWSGGGFKDIRLACGAVAPTPIRLRRVERLLQGKMPSEELVKEAGLAASEACDPLTDLRATSSYRSHVASVIVSRLIKRAWQHLCSDSG